MLAKFENYKHILYWNHFLTASQDPGSPCCLASDKQGECVCQWAPRGHTESRDPTPRLSSQGTDAALQSQMMFLRWRERHMTVFIISNTLETPTHSKGHVYNLGQRWGSSPHLDNTEELHEYKMSQENRARAYSITFQFLISSPDII